LKSTLELVNVGADMLVALVVRGCGVALATAHLMLKGGRFGQAGYQIHAHALTS